uniref:Uncharacterized protein n=1 Tax=Neobodo designis TaxID=312471 RepID=A0A7S1QB22_NEODS|mmetsp:Transcript_3678/g.11591  ORF Transcript_3678/g.11591 Transcript_3678/m.11591 type:complete len:605 (+) Transcript_3678:137-1951(+)
MFTKYTKGTRPTSPAQNAVAVMRYIPAKRRPWLPSRFGPKNLPPDELEKLWGSSRYGDGPKDNWGIYGNEKSRSLRGVETVDYIPKSELERFMPDISTGNQAAVTPVSMMSLRGGHRVTHDLLHAYDPHVGVWSHNRVDHDNITPQDPNRVGLHGNTLGCRSAIYRWLRRGPFAQEGHYWAHYLTRNHGRELVELDAEKPIIARTIRLAKSGQFKAACEQYRRITAAPPVEVFRALLRACVPQGLLADAVSLFEEGTKFKHVTRDAICMRALMQTAINADSPSRVMWVHHLVRGNRAQNVIARAEVELFHAYPIHVIALRYLLDRGCAAEARGVYEYMAGAGLLDYDLHHDAGMALRAALDKAGDGEVVALPEYAALPGAKLAAGAADLVAPLWDSRLPAHERAALNGADASPAARLRRAFADINVDFVLRAAAVDGDTNLLQEDRGAYKDRCLAWLDVLSRWGEEAGAPLPYLLKSRAADASGAHVRVAADPADSRRIGRLAPCDDSRFGFWYRGDVPTRFVRETYPTLSADSNTRKFLVRNPVQREVPPTIADLRAPDADARRQRVPAGSEVHSSVREGVTSTMDLPQVGALGSDSIGDSRF